MQWLPAVCCFALLYPAAMFAEEPPVDQDGRPRIQKLGTIDIDKVENSPVIFHDKVYRCEWYRNKNCFHFVDRDTGRTTLEFAHGWCFANAFVVGDTVYVTGTQHGPKVQMFVSKDLVNWETYTALDLPEHTIFNTSICQAGDRYVMMYEIGAPPEEAGIAFTARFATSADLRHWTVTPPECNYAKDRYTAPHCLRYLDGYFYNFFLAALPGGYEMHVVRSKDLIHWALSPLNPVLRASDEDRKIANPRLTDEQRQRIATARNINNSDLDFCEYRGRLILNYSWGNQQGVEHLAEAIYEGTEDQFLRAWFSDSASASRGVRP
ncbi:MAG: hypothetical protein JW829_14390 [Pirellulales bacterium]|nr:hypothetical protein [Pirellulales bacterium]